MEQILQELKITLKELNLDHLARYVDDLAASVEKTHIAFIGEYNAGKSSLINTLLGKKVVAERDLPTTNRVVLITDCPVQKREKLDEYTELVCLRDDRLKYLVLVDTPGLSSAIREHEDALMRYLHKADLVVVVAPSNQPYTKEIELVLNRLKNQHSTQWAYVINIFEDPSVYEEDPNKLLRLKEFVREKLRTILSAEDVELMPIFAFSVRAVRKGLNDHPLLTKEWEDFKRFIFEEVAQKAQQLKFHSLKEKLLKLLATGDILDLYAKLETYEREIKRWQLIKERVQKEAQRHLEQRQREIEQKLSELLQELERDIEEVIKRYSTAELVKNPEALALEVEQLLKANLFAGERLAEIEALLDYRPSLLRLKRTYPELVVEPTIPPKLRTVVEKLRRDIELLPSQLGRPGYWEMRLLLPLGVALVFGGILLAVLKEKLFEVGIGIAALGGILSVFTLYRVTNAKRLLLKRLKERIETLNRYYGKMYKTYYGEKFGEKLSKVQEYLDTRIGQLELKIETLRGKLEKLDEIKRKLKGD